MSLQMVKKNLGFEVIKSECKNLLKLYRYLRNKYQFTALLESLGEYDDETSRYSIIGVIAKERVYGEKNNCILEDLLSHEVKIVNWLDVLDDWTSLDTCINMDSPLQLGAIGYVGYENKYLFENLAKRFIPDHEVPDVYLVNYSLLFVNDRKNNQSYWVIENGLDKSICFEIEEKYALSNVKNKSFYVLGDVTPDFNKRQYVDSIQKNIEAIRKGDIFQANITMRFHGSYLGDTFELYKHLREKTPNPFFCYFDFEYPLISTSPERFIKIRNKDIYCNPIKGTMKCLIDGKDQKEVLKSSIKNNAENIMITDLIRNDLGRVCKQGTVEVLELCQIKKFNSLYHLESIVYGLLKEDMRISDVFKATYPGGSITGAPKIKALDIIEELEYTVRGPYCGAIGFFGKNGWVDTSIAIRIIYFDQERFYYHAGGGIVVDSTPEEEYNELLLKSERLKSALMDFNILKEKRQKLDVIDKELLNMLNERFSIIRDVSSFKKAYNIPILQSSRVDEMLKKRKEYVENNKFEISDRFIESLYELIIDYSMEIEQKYIG